MAVSAAAGPVTSLDVLSSESLSSERPELLEAWEPAGVPGEAYEQCLDCVFHVQIPEPSDANESIRAAFPRPAQQAAAVPEPDVSWAAIAALLGVALVSAPALLRVVVA